MTKDIGKPTQAEKQAFWAEQMPDFKANYICQSQLEALEFNNKTGNFDALTKDETGFELEDILESYHSVNTGWSMWLKAKAYEAEKSKGCVMVPVEPTPKMIDATWDYQDEIDNMSHNSRNAFIYKNMIRVATEEAARGGNE